MRLSGTKATAIHQYRGLGNQLWDLAGNRPSLDLRFADNKSLVDATTGTTLVDHTRASSGTYVGSDGLIKTAVTNLLTYSDYSQVAGTTDAQLEGTATAPDGTNTARRYSTPSTGLDAINKVTYDGVDGNDYTFSVWVRSTGVATSVLLVTGNPYHSELIGITTTWQRYSITKTANVGNFVRAYVLMINVGDEVEVWGAQVEEGSTPTAYIPTGATINSAPRFHHNPTTGESLGLLVEESRTNLLTYSEDFTNAIWPTSSTATITASTGVDDPQGTNNAATVENVSGPNLHRLITGTAGLSYTYSVWIRRRSGTGPIYLTVGDAINQQITVTNDWTRVYATNIPTSSAVRAYVVIGSTGDSVDIWGAQLEQASTPSTYIPTTTTAVTRSADVASISDGPSGSNFSSWYRQDEGTIFADIVGFPITSGQFPRIFEASDGTSNNIIRSQQYGANTIRNNISAGGSVTMAQDGGIIAAGISGKTVFGVAENNSAIATNGGTPSVDNTVTMPSNLNQLGILGTTGGTSIANSTISRFTYWPQRLPNETLQTITQ